MAREFSIYSGFGKPLDILDDHDLLTKMAQLKHSAREPDVSLRGSGTRMFGVSDLEEDTPAPMTPKPPTRPRTAPSHRTPPAAPASASRLASADEVAARQELARQQLYELRARQRRTILQEAAKMERRGQDADKAVASRREKAFHEAQARVAKWTDKRATSARRVQMSSEKRIGTLTEEMIMKEARLLQWRREEAAEAKRVGDKKEAIRQDATDRFTHKVGNREVEMLENQAKVEARQAEIVRIKRADSARRAEEGWERQVKNMEARAAADKALQVKLQKIEKGYERKAETAAQYKHAQREAWAKKTGQPIPEPTGSHRKPPPHKPGQIMTPRKPKQHDGSTGLEEQFLKCSLCEQKFTSLSGLTYLKAVGTQRASFGDKSLLRWCEKRGLNTMYQEANLCVFCSQFFTDRWQSKGTPSII